MLAAVFIRLAADPHQSANFVRVQQVDANVPAPRQGTDHRPQRPGGTAATPDDLAQVIGMNAHLKDIATAQRSAGHLDVVRIVDDAPD
jgi:hypothetical protein